MAVSSLKDVPSSFTTAIWQTLSQTTSGSEKKVCVCVQSFSLLKQSKRRCRVVHILLWLCYPDDIYLLVGCLTSLQIDFFHIRDERCQFADLEEFQKRFIQHCNIYKSVPLQFTVNPIVDQVHYNELRQQTFFVCLFYKLEDTLSTLVCKQKCYSYSKPVA